MAVWLRATGLLALGLFSLNGCGSDDGGGGDEESTLGSGGSAPSTEGTGGTTNAGALLSCGDFLSASEAATLIANPAVPYDAEASTNSGDSYRLNCQSGGVWFWVEPSSFYSVYLGLAENAVEDNRYGSASFTYGEGSTDICVQVGEFTITVPLGATEAEPVLLAVLANAQAM